MGGRRESLRVQQKSGEEAAFVDYLKDPEVYLLTLKYPQLYFFSHKSLYFFF